MRPYELMVIIDPEVEERTVEPTLQKFLNVITTDGGTIEKVDIWGRRRLAYEIQKKSEGIYADDGNLNYARGDLASLAVNATVDFLLKYRDFGIVARGSYLYDKAKSDKAELGQKAIDHTASYVRVLDLYAFGKFDFAGRALFVRAGDQVPNWGESTFIRNGISILNPVDVAKLRTPGVELKEVLSPTPMTVHFAQRVGVVRHVAQPEGDGDDVELLIGEWQLQRVGDDGPLDRHGLPRGRAFPRRNPRRSPRSPGIAPGFQRQVSRSTAGDIEQSGGLPFPDAPA